jgi:hypothetical protein
MFQSLKILPTSRRIKNAIANIVSRARINTFVSTIVVLKKGVVEIKSVPNIPRSVDFQVVMTDSSSPNNLTCFVKNIDALNPLVLNPVIMNNIVNNTQNHVRKNVRKNVGKRRRRGNVMIVPRLFTKNPNFVSVNHIDVMKRNV